jgi:hypothetical protein
MLLRKHEIEAIKCKRVLIHSSVQKKKKKKKKKKKREKKYIFRKKIKKFILKKKIYLLNRNKMHNNYGQNKELKLSQNQFGVSI